MDVILKADIGHLGKSGKIVSVKDGYARNFLIPQGLALPVTAGNLRMIEEERRKIKGRKEKEKKEASILAEKISQVSCTVKMKVGEEDRLFGTVTAADVVESLRQDGIELDKKKIIFPEPIKRLGIYQIPVKLHPEVTCSIKLWVIEE